MQIETTRSPATEQSEATPHPTWAEAFAAWQEAAAAAEDASRRYDEASLRYEARRPPFEPLMAEPGLQHIDADIRQWAIRAHDLGTVALRWRPACNAAAFERAIEKIGAYRVADQAAEDAAGTQAAAEACDRAYEACSDALGALLQIPAPTPAEALWKLEKLFGPHEFNEEGGSTPCWTAEWAVPVFDDVRRFLGRPA